MPESTIQAAHGIAEFLKWLFAFAIGLLGFNIRRTSIKVDDHDKNHISRTEFTETLKSLRQENREDFKDIRGKIDRLLEK